MSNHDQQQKTPRFSEPELLSLAAVHPWGPWADRVRTRLRIAPLECSFRNPGPASLAPSMFELEPLRNAVDGSNAAATLSIEPVSEEHWPLPPGEIGKLRLGGEGRLAPGRYASRLVLTGSDGESVASVPVALTVRAHWVWAVSFMLLGLVFLGLLFLLAERASLKERLVEALTAQRQLHELLESSPPTLADLPLARQAKEDAAAAVESLTRRRPLGIEDSRLANAGRSLKAARIGMETLRSRTEDKTPGQLAASALEAEWTNLLERLEATRKHLEPAPADATGGEDRLAPRLLAVQRGQWDQRLAPLLLAVEQGLGPQVNRVHLALAAGEQERARKLARHVTVWLRRAARQLEWESEMLLTWRSFAAALLSRGFFLEQAQVDPTLPEPARLRLQRSLTVARSHLADASLEGFRDADRELQRAETELLRVRSQRLIEQLQVAVTEAEERTSLKRVEAALDDLSPDIPKEVGLMRVLDRWRETIAQVEDTERRKPLLERVAALETLVESGDLPATGPAFRELLDAWMKYQEAQTEKAMVAILDPYCQEQLPRLRSQHLGAEESLALLQPHPNLSGLDAELDLIDAELEAGFEGVDCLDRQTQRSGELVEIGDRLYSTYLLVANLTPEARLASAESSESARAVALAQRLMQGPRPIRLELRTPLEEVQVDRKVTFEVGDLGPSWGVGTSIRVDFGDDSKSLLRNAEELRQEPLLQHRYTKPQRAEVRIEATQRTPAGIFEPQGEMVGEGRLAVTVSPSPITLARSLAGFFLSLRFALALAIGLLIQGWRLYDKHPFGSRPRDYLEAFALGVGVQGLIEGFSTALLQLASGAV